MIYSEIYKKDSKEFIVKSPFTHILLNGYIIKLIKIKIFHDSVLIFYRDKHNKKIYQRLVRKSFFYQKAGTPLKIFDFVFNYKPILAFKNVRKLGYRYKRRYLKNLINF